MPSARDEGRRPKALNDASSDPSKNQAEKKPADVADQLASLQENLRRLNEIRQRIHQASGEDDVETKKKNSAKTGSTNVIPFPVPPRFDDTTAPEQPSAAKRSATAPQDSDETPPPPTDELISSADAPVVEEPARSRWAVSEPPPNRSDEDFTPPPRFDADTTKNVAPDEPVFTRSRYEASVLNAKADPDEPEAISPEVVAPRAPLFGDTTLPSKRSAAVDAEIRALVKQYGEVDIYSNRQQTGKHSLIKVAVASFLLIAMLAVSYLFLL